MQKHISCKKMPQKNNGMKVHDSETNNNIRVKIKRPSLIIMLLLILTSIAVKNEAAVYVLCAVLILIIAASVKFKIGLLTYAAILLVILAYARGLFIYKTQSALLEYDSVRINLTAQLVTYPEYGETDAQGIFKTLEINGSKTEPEKILVKFYDDNIDIVPGGVYKITGVLRIAQSASNPGGFDYKTYLSTLNIKSYMNVYSAPEYVRHDDIMLIYDDILSVRSTLDKVIKTNLDSDMAGLLSGVLFGESYMDEDVLNSFRAIGAAHVLAVSGLHVGILYGFISFIFKKLKFSHKAQFFAGAFILLFYCAVTGFSPSVIRASLMITLMSLTKVVKTQSDSFNFLCIAAIIMLLYNPMTFYSVSFQMSFCAAASILIFVNIVEVKLKKTKYAFINSMRSLTILSVIVQIGLTPISVYYFNNLNLISVFANLLIVPVISVVVVGGLIIMVVSLILPFAAPALFSIMGVILKYLIEVARLLSEIELTYFYVPSPRIREIVLFYFLMFACFGYFRLSKNKKRLYIFCAATLVMTAWCATLYLNPVKTKVCFIDVGLGDCCLVMTDTGENILIDAGGYLERDTAQYNIMPFMEYYKITSLDAVIATHSHSDHIYGIYKLIEHGVNIETVYANEDYTDLYYEVYEAAQSNNIPVKPLYAGDVLKFGDTVFNVLLPYEEMLEEEYINDTSIVLSVTAGDVNFLLLGDIETYGMKTLLDNYYLAATDVIKANHHGEYNDYTLRLYDEADPDICVICVANNSYGLPKDEFYDVLYETDTQFFTTMDNGLITFIVDDGEYKVDTYKN